MADLLKQFNIWKEAELPEDLRKEIEAIENDSDEIYERFCKELRFGTSGLRGKMGVGTNRINSITLKKASVGIANYLKEYRVNPKVVISYDTRNNSKRFADEVSKIYSNLGVDCYVFPQPTPVPVLSFVTRAMKMDCGIMITASHNPKEYNGYKVYDRHGNQIDSKKAAMIETMINQVDPFKEYIENDEIKGFIKAVPETYVGAYLDSLARNTLYWTDEDQARKAMADLKICYTPLNGSGRPYVLTALEEIGVKPDNILEVKSQAVPDGNFPTCPYPNPEIDKAFDEALTACADNAETFGMADIIIATDPDSDRMGLAVYDGVRYQHLTGNQVGELMFAYICDAHKRGIGGRTLDARKVCVKTYVSSPVIEDIARHYGVRVKNVFAGFKNVAYEMEKLEEAEREDDFLFGFEESLGYLYGNYTRDKDGVMAAQMASLMAAKAKSEGKTLMDVLSEVYDTFGYLESISQAKLYKTEKDRDEIAFILERFLKGALKDFVDTTFKVEHEICYREQQMYCADLVGGHRIIIRPSGTELKIKTYIFAKGQTRNEAINNASRISIWLRDVLNMEAEEYAKCDYRD